MKQDNKRVRDLSLQDLEGSDWGEPDYDSSLVREAHRLRRVPLKEFRIKDLRLMIGQEIGLTYLVPLALDHLVHHPLAKGGHYHGDLLRAVATVSEKYWRDHPDERPKLVKALHSALLRIRKVSVPHDLEAFLTSSLERHQSARGKD